MQDSKLHLPTFSQAQVAHSAGEAGLALTFPVLSPRQ